DALPISSILRGSRKGFAPAPLPGYQTLNTVYCLFSYGPPLFSDPFQPVPAPAALESGRGGAVARGGAGGAADLPHRIAGSAGGADHPAGIRASRAAAHGSVAGAAVDHGAGA